MTELYPTEIELTPDARPYFDPLAEMYVERGTKKDWDLLHHLHYKSDHDPIGARYYRLVLHDETIGVACITQPRPLLKERHQVWKELRPGNDTKASNKFRYKWVNNNIVIIGRIVLDTLYRGVGASYRFQNIVARMSGMRIVEIQSSMSKYNPFAQKAGFEFVKPMRSNKFDVGMKFFRANFDTHPADLDGLLKEIESLPAAAQKPTIDKIKHFYYAHSANEKTGDARDIGKERVARMPTALVLKQLQQLVLSSPLSGVYINPDYGRELPARIPLTAFDNQKTTEPLNVSF
jgi:ABC-type ATPase with predicted acetyltransferase domain